MNKKRTVVILSLIIIALVALLVCALFLFGAFSTPALAVNNFLTTNQVVEKAKENEDVYELIADTNIDVRSGEALDKLNRIKINITTVIGEYQKYTLFVKNTSISNKKLNTAYEKYLQAQSFALLKLKEVQSAQLGADIPLMISKLNERYIEEIKLYNNFCTELINYVETACFVDNAPKTQSYCTLKFCANYNNYLVNNFVATNSLTTEILGISQCKSSLDNYKELLLADKQCNNQRAINFVLAFDALADYTNFYKNYNSNTLGNYVDDINNFSNYKEYDVNEQQQCAKNIFLYIVQSSYVD